jgi:uncharacterized LabA/DUF88 family protein
VYSSLVRPEPTTKRAIVFIDGQNLYHSVRAAFDYTYPNYDVLALAQKLCAIKGWQLKQVRFYTEVPDIRDNRRWHQFWSKKLAVMGRRGIHVFSRTLRYRNEVLSLPGQPTYTVLVGEEKGIDVRIALDIIRLAHRGDYDVALMFSQDQDLSEAADEVRLISHEQQRWIKSEGMNRVFCLVLRITPVIVPSQAFRVKLSYNCRSERVGVWKDIPSPHPSSRYSFHQRN